MRKGDRILVIRGRYAGRAGIVRRRCRGGYIVNVDSGRTGIPMSPLLRASDIRRVHATSNATKPVKT